MKQLPENPNFDFLRAEAKDLLQAIRSADPSAIQKVRDFAPHLVGAAEFQLANAQFIVAREYGFSSWAALKAEVAAIAVLKRPRSEWGLAFCEFALGRGFIGANVDQAKRLLKAAPSILDDPYVACAAGDLQRVKVALAEPEWMNLAGGPFQAPPLVMCTHSKLILDSQFRDGIFACVRLLLEAGAEVNGSYVDPSFPGAPLSALYGAAGRVGDAEMTKLLLEAGANPDDNESVYHSVEVHDDECLRLVLAAGAKVSGTNAIFHCLDGDRPARLNMLLEAGGDPNEKLGHSTTIYWAIYRRRSAEHVRALLNAGANSKSPYSESYYALAMRAGLPDVAALFVASPLSTADQFCALAAAGDEPGARAILESHPDIITQLGKAHLRVLPELASAGDVKGVETLVRLGWPIDTLGGDWSASALNLAVFRGDGPMTEFLLQNGASWETKHGHGDNVIGTLRFASEAKPYPNGDYFACARALIRHGVPVKTDADRIWSEDMREFLETLD